MVINFIYLFCKIFKYMALYLLIIPNHCFRHHPLYNLLYFLKMFVFNYIFSHIY